MNRRLFPLAIVAALSFAAAPGCKKKEEAPAKVAAPAAPAAPSASRPASSGNAPHARAT